LFLFLAKSLVFYGKRAASKRVHFILDIVNSASISEQNTPTYFCPINFDKQFHSLKKRFFPMKHIISVLALATFFAFNATAQQASGPAMSFETTTIDYGKIEKGSDKIRKFKFTNTGNEPLIIKSAKGSCGCTVPTYPQEPIMPGESATIDVSYDTNRTGPFTKTVTLTTNETPDSHTLTIKGEVKVPATQETVPASNGGIKN
jgi:hypothetical protein